MDTMEFTWSELRCMAKDFLDNLPTASEESIYAGFKCLCIGYFRLKTSDPFQEHQAVLLIEMIAKKVAEKVDGNL